MLLILFHVYLSPLQCERSDDELLFVCLVFCSALVFSVQAVSLGLELLAGIPPALSEYSLNEQMSWTALLPSGPRSSQFRRQDKPVSLLQPCHQFVPGAVSGVACNRFAGLLLNVSPSPMPLFSLTAPLVRTLSGAGGLSELVG